MISPTDILNAKSIANYVFVRVPSELNDFAGFVKDEHGNEVKLVLNPNWKPTHHVRICGEVIAAPDSITESDFRYEKYLGSPKPQMYRNHEFVRNYIKSLPPRMPMRERLKVAPKYKCYSVEPEFQTIVGIKPLVQKGDLVYFHYNTLLKEENFCWREDNGDLVYKTHYINLFCFVRDGKITMLNGYVLVSAAKELGESFEVDGVKVRGKKHGDLVLVEHEEDVKENTKLKYLTGILEHIGEPVSEDDNARYEEPGTKVLFRPNSQFKNTIEGKEYMVMGQWDLVATVRDSEIRAIGDYVVIKPDGQLLSTKTKLVEYNANKDQPLEPNQLFIPEGTLDQAKKITKVGLGGIVNCLGVNFHGLRIAYYKSSDYLYVKEFDVVLIRYGDILGWFENDS